MSAQRERISRTAILIVAALLLAGALIVGAMAWVKLSRTQTNTKDAVYIMGCGRVVPW